MEAAWLSDVVAQGGGDAVAPVTRTFGQSFQFRAQAIDLGLLGTHPGPAATLRAAMAVRVGEGLQNIPA